MSSRDEVRALLERKKGLLLIIAEVTAKQYRLIDETLTMELMDNIQQRQQLIDQIDAIDAGLPPREVMALDAECKNSLDEIHGVLEKVVAQDKINEALALKRSDELQAELKRAGEATRAAGAYNRVITGGGASFDA